MWNQWEWKKKQKVSLGNEANSLLGIEIRFIVLVCPSDWKATHECFRKKLGKINRKNNSNETVNIVVSFQELRRLIKIRNILTIFTNY